jgi:hypothetical protein
MLAMCDDEGGQGVCISSPAAGTFMFMGDMASFEKEPLPQLPLDLLQIPKI